MHLNSAGRIAPARFLLIAGLIAAALPNGSALAQSRDLDAEDSVGKVVQARFGDNGTPAQFTLTLPAGESRLVQAIPMSGRDPVLTVFDAASGKAIARDDDSGGSLAAEVLLYSAAAQPVRIEVASAGEQPSADAGPDFTLLLLPSDTQPNPVLDMAGPSFSHAGELMSGEEQLFRFTARPGQEWAIGLSAPEGSGIDPFLEVFEGEFATGEVVVSDDDSGGGLASALLFAPNAPGTYTLRVSGLGDTAGAYALAAETLSSTSAPESERLEPGSDVVATLERPTQVRSYRLGPQALARLRRGGSLQIDMLAADDDFALGGPVLEQMQSDFEPDVVTVPVDEVFSPGSSALDPQLALGFETPLGFAPLLTDDDGAGDLDARLLIAPGEGLQLDSALLDLLRVRASAVSGSGSYTLRVSEAE